MTLILYTIIILKIIYNTVKLTIIFIIFPFDYDNITYSEQICKPF